MKCKTETTKKSKAEDRKKEQQSRRKIGILVAAAIVLVILSSICLLLLQNKAGSKGEWRALSREETTWNTRESLDTSKARSKRYEKLKKDYFSEERPRGIAVWEEGVPACTLGDMYQSDLCVVITVTAGYEEDKNYFEAEVEQYIYDRTGRYADHLFVKDAPARAMSFYGRIPAKPGQRMAVFLDVDNYGICNGKLIWNYFISEDGYVVPMTEDYDDEREEDEAYVGMWDYGGYALEDYLAVLQTGYHLQESQEQESQERGSQEWEREQKRYERIRAIKEVKPIGILSQTDRLPLKLVDDEEVAESSRVKLTMEYPVYPLETTWIYGFIENTEEMNIHYFNYAMDVWKDGLWHRIPYRREVESLKGSEVLAGADDAYIGNLRMWDYDFPQGRYRVVLYYRGENGSASEKESYYRVYAEFELRADAKLPELGALGRQSQKEKQAELFFHKAILGIPSKLRLVDNDEGLIKEFACKRNYQDNYPEIVYTVTIQKGDDSKTVTYPFFDIRKEEGRTSFIFTTYDGVEDSENLEIAWPEGFGAWYPWDSVTVLSQPQGEEAEWFLRLAEQARKKVVFRFNAPRMIVYNQASTRKMYLFYSEASGEAGWSLYDNQAAYDLCRAGKEYTLQGEYPVYVFPIGEEDFGVLFQRKDNCCLGRHYRGEDGELLGIVEGSQDEIIQKLREAGEEEQDGL